MYLLAIITVILLNIISFFHIYWAFGGKVGLDKVLPTKDGVRLLNPTRALTFFVGIVLFGFSGVAYLLYFDTASLGIVVYIGWMLSAIFFIRAIGEFNAIGFFKKIKNTEFAEYDTKYFSPLCLFLGVVFAILSVRI